MRRALVWFALFALAPPLAVCTPFSSEEEASSSGNGGHDAASADAASADAAVESSARFCDREDDLYCDDYEGPPTGKWANAEGGLSAKPVPGTIEDAGGRDGGRGLRFTLLAGPGSGSVARRLQLPTQADLEVSADVWIARPRGRFVSNALGLIVVRIDEAGHLEAKLEARDDGGVRLSHYTTSADAGAPSRIGDPTLAFERWTRITVESRLVGTSTAVVMVRHDQDGGVQQVVQRATFPPTTETVLAIGLVRTAPTETDLEVIFDNVTVRALP